jgi:hypothetical protein
MPVFDLNRCTVLKMHEQQVKYVGTLLHVKSLRNFAARMLAGLSNDDARMRVPAAVNLVSNVLHFYQMGLRPKVGDKRAAPCDPFDIALIIELSQRAIGGHARDIHRLDEFVFRWNPITGAQFAGRDAIDDQVL